MKRVLEIEKFRNIGIEEKQTLVLNSSMKKGQMGNLVIVIGENNSGKSNVLAAINKLSSREFSSRDITDLSFEDKYKNPSVKLVTKDADGNYSVKISVNDRVSIEYPKKDAKKLSLSTLVTQDMKLITFILLQYKTYGYGTWNSELNDLKSKFSNKLTEEIAKQLHEELMSLTERILNYNRNAHPFRSIRNNIINSMNDCVIIQELMDNNDDIYKKASETYLNTYGVKFLPAVYNYKETPITTDNLYTTYNRLENCDFFKSVLTSIKVNYSEILNAYDSFTKNRNRGILKSLENKLNKKLKSVAKKFNDLYYLNESYKFEIILETENIYFSIFKDTQALNLDWQSTGFRWFFNLYFNLLCNNKLAAGDILIMDEPATNLHVSGQIELRKALKEFAVKNDITIVIATHSPFLIDLDYLDELRFVSLTDNGAEICNDFSTADISNPDSLNPVKKALTVHNYILCDPDIKVVFVEGITDYNYMVAFKNKLGIKDIVFLPIQGIGTAKSKQTAITKTLIEIRKHDPILMTDGDNAGKNMKALNKDSALNVFTLSDVDAQFTTIETLFEKQDALNLGIINEKGQAVKHSADSAILKTFVIDNAKLSTQTIDNFKKLFEHINSL